MPRKTGLLSTVIGVIIALLILIIAGLAPYLALTAVTTLMVLGILKIRSLAPRKETGKPIVTVPDQAVHKPRRTNAEIQRDAFYRLIPRITAEIGQVYPNARWIWENPNPLEVLLRDQNADILLSRAGGYSRATVYVNGLKLSRVMFNCPVSICTDNDRSESETSTSVPVDTGNASESNEETIPTDFSLLAYDWAEQNAMDINRRCNEAVAEGAETLLIGSDELPSQQESWTCIAEALIDFSCSGADVMTNGILVHLPGKEKRG